MHAAPTRARFGSSGPAALGTTRIGAPPSSSIGGSTRIGIEPTILGRLASFCVLLGCIAATGAVAWSGLECPCLLLPAAVASWQAALSLSTCSIAPHQVAHPLRFSGVACVTILSVACECELCTGGLGSIGLGGLGTLSGLNRQTPAVKTAAERAAEAAARIPEPPVGTPRQKPKSVTFVEDGELACVRYFLKV